MPYVNEYKEDSTKQIKEKGFGNALKKMGGHLAALAKSRMGNA